MAKPDADVDPSVLIAFEAMIAAVPGVERKGAAMPYTSINGNMYAMISKADVIGIRLSKADLAAAFASGLEPFEGTPGFINKEYAGIPPAMLVDHAALKAWFEKSHAFAAKLKPKKTTR
jgi:hypothetical protein